MPLNHVDTSVSPDIE
ncbi:hypothetical protein G2583_0997 [Escherichia coli O55:H7 str. CB9615]|nr:hypothetical protein G2583_0997 [Escherichia coli O55:H7 str. CB9615]